MVRVVQLLPAHFSTKLECVAAVNPGDEVCKLNRIIPILVVKISRSAPLISAGITRCSRLAVIREIEARQRQILRGIRRYPIVYRRPETFRCVPVLHKRPSEGRIKVVEEFRTEGVIVLQSIILRVKCLSKRIDVYPGQRKTWELPLEFSLDTIGGAQRNSLLVRDDQINLLSVIL